MDVELSAEVVAALGDQTPRQLRNAVAHAVGVLRSGELDGQVRPWDLPALARGVAELGDVTSARVVHLSDVVLVVELLPSARRIALRRIDYGWRLARFVPVGVTDLPPETTRRVPLAGSSPDAVLATMGIARPDGVELEYATSELGQGETEYRSGYRWTEGTRSIIAEEVTREIFDGATPATRYVRGVVVDGEHGLIVSGSGEDALLIEG